MVIMMYHSFATGLAFNPCPAPDVFAIAAGGVWHKRSRKSFRALVSSGVSKSSSSDISWQFLKRSLINLPYTV
jgi:hypothetical protein